MSDSRWQRIGLPLAAALVIPGVLVLAPAGPRPGFTVTLASVSPSGSSTSLHYHASVLGGERVEPGDFFRVVDVPGYVPGSAGAPEGWSVSSETASTAPPPGVVPTRADDPALWNLVFTYRGPGRFDGPKVIPGFSARSTSGQPRAVRGFVGRTTRRTGPSAGAKVDSAGDVRGPGAVPEPTSLVSTCLGVILLGVFYARSHRRKLRVS